MGLACTRPDENSVIHFPQKVLLLGQSGAGDLFLSYDSVYLSLSTVRPQYLSTLNRVRSKLKGKKVEVFIV